MSGDKQQKMWLWPILILTLLTLLNILSLTDRFLIAAFGAQITAELNLSNQQFGLLTGFGFVLFYAVAGPFMGILADRFGASRLLGIGILLWSAMTALTGQAKSFVGVMLPRAFVGIGEATLNPASSAILSKTFDQQHRATVLGLYFMGGHIGIALSYQIGGIAGIDWRQAFMALGIAGLILAVLLMILARSNPAAFGEDTSTQTTSSNASLGELASTLKDHLVHNPTLRLAILGMALVHLIYAEIQFLQLWLVSERGFSPQEASGLYGQVYLLTALPASILGGVAADWLAKRAGFNRASFIFVVILLTLPFVVLFRFSEPGSTWFLVGMIASITLFTLPYGAMISTILDEVPENIRASTTAMTMFAVNVLVIGLATYGLGLASDLFANMGRDEPLTDSLLILDGLLVLSLFAYGRLHSRLNQS
ncbi:sugar phosphate permease [gamma proteobacterium HIMB55]|nr:sugar phosphate permease [gamma proteobacterium HIMB55]